MTFNINREKLLKPLSAVVSIVEKRHTLPILSNVLIVAENQQLTLTATDLEMQISLIIATENANALSTTLSARKLLDICRSLPESSEMNLTAVESRITLKAGKSRFNLQTLPAADYPLMSKAENANTLLITIAQNKLKQLLKQVEFAMAQQDIRYYLNGLLIEVNGNKLSVVGTDGHRLSFTSTELTQSYEKQEFILPRKTVIELIKLLDDSEHDVNIEISQAQVNFSFGEIRLISKVIDGKFPDYNRVIPTNHQNSFIADRVAILTAMQRASILSNEKYRGIRMVLSANSLRMISTNSEQEEAEEELEINYEQDTLDIGFNVTYMIDVLNNVNSQNVTFSFADANSSCLVTVAEDPNYKYVVMPMRI